ncbi:MAG: nuclear transport factor 2 family protein [Solirubrobacterales bacterium]
MGDRDEATIDALRRAYEAFNRGDYDGALEIASPDVGYTRPGVEAPLKGAGEVRAWMEPDAFDSQRIEPLEFQVNGNRVLVRQRFHARGAESGIELDVHSWAVFTLDEDGLVARAEMYLQHEEAEARRAAGLSSATPPVT